MIDIKWVEENIKDDYLKTYLTDNFIYEGETEYRSVQELIDDIISSENDSMDDHAFNFRSWEELEEQIVKLQRIAAVLELLDTFTE